jgi:hypothetical protein
MSTGTDLPQATNIAPSMNGEAGPDLRSWLDTLEAAGELRHITAPVDWDEEIGAITARIFHSAAPGCCSRTSSATRTPGAQSF